MIKIQMTIKRKLIKKSVLDIINDKNNENNYIKLINKY